MPDGHNTLTLRSAPTKAAGSQLRDDIVITVNAPAIPTANAGADRTVADTDGEPGEAVTLDGSASTDPDGSIAAFSGRVVMPKTSRNCSAPARR